MQCENFKMLVEPISFSSQYPMPDLVMKEKSYKACYEETLHMAEEIRAVVEIGVFVVVGPYPVDILPLQEKFGRETAITIMRKGIEEAAVLCKEQKCIAIGEIGRPHFPFDQQILQDSNDILCYGMQKAKDAGVPVVLHTESTTPSQCEELVEIGKKVGLNPEKIVKHFSPPLITYDENFGLMPSVLASKKNIVEALHKGTRFLMQLRQLIHIQTGQALLLHGADVDPRNIMITQLDVLIHVQILEAYFTQLGNIFGRDIVPGELDKLLGIQIF